MKHATEQGLGLIEVLIATLVLSVGLLGATALQAQAQAAAQHADWQYQALRCAQDMAQAMRSNPVALAQGAYTAPQAEAAAPASTQACHTAPCSPVARAEHDVQQWRQHVAERLPGGRGALLATGPQQRRLVVMWQPPRQDEATACPAPWPSDFSCLSLEVWL
jgi:type IV pilus assembly protein PilV